MGFFDRFVKPPSKDKFARMVMDRIHQAGETEEIVFHKEEYRVARASGIGPVLFLGNAYREWCDAPKDKLDDILGRWIRNWFTCLKETPKDFEDVKPDILPVIRSRAYFELTRLMLEVEERDIIKNVWPYEVLGEHFAIGLVYDLPDSMRWIAKANLTEWGASFYEAMEAGRHNLIGLKHGFVGPESVAGPYLSACGDGYDASRLLLDDVIGQIQVKGKLIAMIPNRDTLILAGSEDEKSLAAMVAFSTEVLQKPRPISGIALRHDMDGSWMPWLPDVGHPLRKEFQQLQIHSLGQDYAEQKELLDKLHEKQRCDIFVATYLAFEDPQGRLQSYSVWGEGVDSLLPKTDAIAFMRHNRQPLIVDWQRVVDVVGELMEEVDTYPTRFRVRTFPSGEQLARLE